MRLKDELFNRVSIKNHKNIDVIMGISLENCVWRDNVAFLCSPLAGNLRLQLFNFSDDLSFVFTGTKMAFPTILVFRFLDGGIILRNHRVSADISAFFMKDFPFLEEEGYELLTTAYPELDAGILKEVANLELESRRKYDLVG